METLNPKFQGSTPCASTIMWWIWIRTDQDMGVGLTPRVTLTPCLTPSRIDRARENDVIEGKVEFGRGRVVAWQRTRNPQVYNRPLRLPGIVSAADNGIALQLTEA